MGEHEVPEDKLCFSSCVVYATVGSLVDRDLSSDQEALLLKALHQENGGRQTNGKLYAGRPHCRWGVHPDVLLRTGLTGHQESVSAQELCIGATIEEGVLQPAYLLDAVVDEEVREDLETHVKRLGSILWPTDLAEERKREYPVVSAATLLVRLFPTGVATCTVHLTLRSSAESPVSDSQIDSLLKCLDPRRRSASNETFLGMPPPDLATILTGMLAAISNLAGNAIRGRVEKELAEGKIDEQKGKKLAAGTGTLFPNIGVSLRARVNWVSDTLPTWAHPEVEQLPYCTLDLEMGGSPFWNESGSEVTTRLHRRLFHLMAGSYLGLASKTLRVPAALDARRGGERLRSLTWSSDSLVIGSARGAAVLFRSQDGGEWLEVPDVIVAFRQSTLDVVEGMIGVWNALGLLNVRVDAAIQELRREPRENVKPLEDLVTARRIFARLLSEPIFYQAEGSSVRSISMFMRQEFGVTELREALLQKLSEVRDLHDLQLHVAALQQIRAERGE